MSFAQIIILCHNFFKINQSNFFPEESVGGEKNLPIKRQHPIKRQQPQLRIGEVLSFIFPQVSPNPTNEN
jgi:hypothetical protein